MSILAILAFIVAIISCQSWFRASSSMQAFMLFMSSILCIIFVIVSGYNPITVLFNNDAQWREEFLDEVISQITIKEEDAIYVIDDLSKDFINSVDSIYYIEQDLGDPHILPLDGDYSLVELKTGEKSYVKCKVTCYELTDSGKEFIVNKTGSEEFLTTFINKLSSDFIDKDIVEISYTTSKDALRPIFWKIFTPTVKLYSNDNIADRRASTKEGKEVILYGSIPTVIDNACFITLGYRCSGAYSIYSDEYITIGNYCFNLSKGESKIHLLPSSENTSSSGTQVGVDVSVKVKTN